MKNITTLIPLDFKLIMIMALILTLLNIIIIVTILFQLDCTVHYWINIAFHFKTIDTNDVHVTIVFILIILIFKIKNMIKLIQIQMIYVLILNKLKIKSSLKMKTIASCVVVVIQWSDSQLCKQLVGMSSLYLFIHLIL